MLFPAEGFVYHDSRCYSVILVDQPVKSIDTNDCTVTPIRGGGSRLRLRGSFITIHAAIR
jgi:hypothetical protein